MSDPPWQSGQVGQPSPESAQPHRAAGDDDDHVGDDRCDGEAAQRAAVRPSTAQGQPAHAHSHRNHRAAAGSATAAHTSRVSTGAIGKRGAVLQHPVQAVRQRGRRQVLQHLGARRAGTSTAGSRCRRRTAGSARPGSPRPGSPRRAACRPPAGRGRRRRRVPSASSTTTSAGSPCGCQPSASAEAADQRGLDDLEAEHGQRLRARAAPSAAARWRPAA